MISLSSSGPVAVIAAYGSTGPAASSELGAAAFWGETTSGSGALFVGAGSRWGFMLLLMRSSSQGSHSMSPDPTR